MGMLLFRNISRERSRALHFWRGDSGQSFEDRLAGLLSLESALIKLVNRSMTHHASPSHLTGTHIDHR